MGRVLCLVMGYVFGLFQTGYLYGKMNHIDIRNYGSGNSGTTNALRVLGKKAGLIVFAGDFLKTVFACLAARIIFKASPDTDLYVLYAGLGVVLGHNFPCYLHFKGGKGIASMAGILVSMDWRVTLVCAAVPRRCDHHKICVPGIDPGRDLILHPDAALWITGGLPCVRRKSHGVFCHLLYSDGDGDLETQGKY